MSSWEIVRSGERVVVGGELRIGDAAPIWHRLGEAVAAPGEHLDFDLRDAQLVDGAIMSLLVDLRASLVAHGTLSEIVGAPDRVEPIVHLYRGDQPPEPAPAPPRHRYSPISAVGGYALRVAAKTRSLVRFTAHVLGAAIADVRQINWRSIPGLVERAGTDGIPIVLVLTFLVGFVMGYQSMRQLQNYGASIYVADVVGVSVTRELAPLMTAIIVAGRSGAAYAAELGTMCVSEEIDALRTMGISPVSYLVVPRTIALAVAAPVLTLLGSVSGVTGGLVVAVTSLGITPHAYVAELRTIVEASDVWTGVVKSVAFGIAIAFIGCRQGLAARSGASGVGRSTTSTVVSCLFAIVVIDTLFTMLFRELGL